jgi:glycosyltransferase involved in cell wall biosynthesis
MRAPSVSIVIPTYGRVRWLREALASVYAQTLADWELIIADDGSDEETRAFLRGVEADGSARVLWLSHTGKPAVVRNAALRVATGTYVAFLDSDDLWLPQKLSTQLEALRTHPDCGWSYTAFTNVDSAGRALAADSTRAWVPYDGAIFERVVTGEASIRTPSVMALRDLIAQAGGFDEAVRSGEDYDLWMRLALRSRAAVVDESLVRIRHHEDHHSEDWESALIGRDHSLRTMQRVAEPRWRPLLERERAANATNLAANHLRLKHYPAAAAAFRDGLPLFWRHPRSWFVLAKATARPFVPVRLLDAYHRGRKS